MTVQEYIQLKLEDLGKPGGLSKPGDDEQMVADIYKAALSKKFRKYSVEPEYLKHIKSAIELCVSKKEPIKFSMVFGGYKLWRLEESPEPDWAELFSVMYYVAWVKPICEIYEPGVWFDYFSDDAIVPNLNNVPKEDVKKYLASFSALLDVVKPYLLKNLSLTLNRVADQYDSEQAFETDLAKQAQDLQESLDGKLPELTEEMKHTIELSVRVTPEQAKDPHWREKVLLIHDGYAKVMGRRPYYRTPDKLMVATRPIPNCIAVGTTKDSVMKYWIGAGVLRPKDDSFRQLIYSPTQLTKASFKYEAVSVQGLNGKNFSKIRVLE